jgi:hypothetical protein
MCWRMSPLLLDGARISNVGPDVLEDVTILMVP